MSKMVKPTLSLKELLLIKKHYIDLKLPMNIKNEFKVNEIKKIIYFMKKDKKNTSEKINLVLLSKIGKIANAKKTIFESNEIEKFLKSYYI